MRVLARDPRRDTASWAAVGIFPPAPPGGISDPNAVLTAMSHRLHGVWAQELRAETGIDNGLVASGGVHVAADASRLQALRSVADSWLARGAECEWLSAHGVAEVEPALADAVHAGRIAGGFFLPGEIQFRSPRHLEALEKSCRDRGVVIDEGHSVDRIDVTGGRVRGLTVKTPQGTSTVSADCFIFAAGAWTGSLVEVLGLTIDTRPIRGQIVLMRCPHRRLSRIVNRGLDYLVPRDDGLILAGSTLEDVGFDATTVPATIDRLVGVAEDLLGNLTDATIEKAWAGLRPGSADGLPSIGRVADVENAFVAAGHFRAGLHQSTGTAVLIADLLEQREPSIDIAAFRPGRSPRPAGPDSMATLLARAGAKM